MNAHPFHLAGEALLALPSGALWVPAHRLLCVSDLHLGKAERIARNGHALLPPYDTVETLARLDAAIGQTDPVVVICLGDSFDDLAAADGLTDTERLWLTRLIAGRDWIWIAGNHDPGPLDLAGSHRCEFHRGALTFRHVAEPATMVGEVSGHYHPKATIGAHGRRVRRPCFLTDGVRLILPAFGAYTGGLDCRAPELQALMGQNATAILTGRTQVSFPLESASGR